MYAADALELKNLQGQLPKAQLEKMRGQLKSKYQKITPPEIEKLLRATFEKSMIYEMLQVAITPVKRMRE
jgi:hypothetical protein